jgi:signal peptidase I
VTPERHSHPSWTRTLIIGRNPAFTLIRACVLGAATFLIFKFALMHVLVSGPSMEPNYPNGSTRYVNRLAYLLHEPRRGDVVAIRLAGPSVVLLKRIVGLPGERVGFARGHVTINGEPLDEPYLKFPSDWVRAPVTLGADEYFVVGDNRSMPIENHTLGIAKRERILGKTLR